MADTKKKLKDKKIVIYRAVDVSEPGDMPKVKYKPVHPGKIWAYVRQTSASEIFFASSTFSQESMNFVIAWRPDIISLEDFIMYNGVFYNIQRVDTFEGYKSDITITGNSMLVAPDPDDFLPYEDETE